MSEEKPVRLNRGQFDALESRINGVRGAVNRLAEAVAPLEDKESISAKLGTITELMRNQNVIVNIDLKPLADEVKAGFDKVAEAIAKLQTLPPSEHKPKGILMARYRVPADAPDISFELVGSGFADSKGNLTGAADIDLSAESGGESMIVSTGEQRLSDDGQQVIIPITLRPNTTSVDFVAVTYKATNRDTGNVVAADSDEFIVGPGEASVGTLDSPVPLTAEPTA